MHTPADPIKMNPEGSFADWAGSRGWAVRAWLKQGDDLVKRPEMLTKALDKVFCYDRIIRT